jgi:peptidyl-prolyl cis-trans isomerase SurA
MYKVRPMKIAVVVCAAAALCLCSLAARAEILERVGAVVNGQPLVYSDIVERVQPELAKVDKLPPAEREKARKELLLRSVDQLVDEKLVEAEAATYQVEVTEEETNKQAEALARQNGLTLEQFKEELAKQKVDYAQVRDGLKRQTLRYKLLQAKVKPRKITEEEIKAAYAQRTAHPEYEVRARHIFIRIPPSATPEQLEAARDKAELALRRVTNGDEFAVVARDLSDGPTAKQGGDLGYFKRGLLLPELENAALQMKPGESSGLIKTAAGYHLVHVEDRRALPVKPLAEMQEEIRQQLGSESIVGEQTRFLQQLRKAAQVDIRL